ncbi:Grx4 family monothiol glutaredoxin [Lentisphaera profundi]|uniref:Glutaredoxin n=1 Tax=Lentisphaera profundi TaxID=1658616 RepID=A0ABY7VSA7_9BACT|nr:Grx4 family monothiol glutaredoxin [Lentisphaera profundi]WDE96100.1 Grx4 family monothiol glutaredoxin [Lentisphaera profundi]
MSDINTIIKTELDAHPVKLFMKGIPSAPQCGFSQTVIQILSFYDVEYSAMNILENPDFRQGLKDYFEWPTFPQLVVKGELVGGCDIIMELHESGELKELLESATK